MNVRVLVVDDHPFYREGIKTLLGAWTAHVEVVGEASSGEDAVELCRELRPDVVLMDLQMPGLGGLEATRQITQAHPATAVLVLTMSDDDSVLPALRAGARGYLLKDAGVADVVRAIESVHAGQSVLAPQAAERLNRRLADPATARPFPQLTDREHQIVAELLRGASTAEIARRLSLSDKTVRNYVSAILTKLSVRDRAQLVLKAREAGYPEEPV
jgi:DNA-binding NarL/FixJ family response regulator